MMTPVSLPVELLAKIRADLIGKADETKAEYLAMYALAPESLVDALTGKINPDPVVEGDDPVEWWIEACELALYDTVISDLSESEVELIDNACDDEGRLYGCPSVIVSLLAEVELEVFGVKLSDPDNPDDYGL